ncbi:MAG: GNAT family N-acetyltransferase [Oscillospiraceae bacterium]
MRYIFIVNPKAGVKNIIDDVRKKAENYFSGSEDNYKVYETSGKGDATKIAHKECESGEKVRIYGFGGDGTLLEIVRGAVGRANAEVGIFPSGSGNDYIRTYGEREQFLDFDKQIHGRSISIDMIDTLAGSAINICSVGLDAKVAYEMSNFKSIPGVKGSFAYDLALLKCLTGKIGDQLTVKMKTVEGEKEFQGNYIFALAAGGKCYGGGFMGAPKAVTNDGLLDLILIKRPPLYRIPGLVKLYKNGHHLASPKFKDILTFYRGYELEISSNDEIYCNRDGECEKIKREKFSLSKGSLRFILPLGVEYEMKPIHTERLVLRNWREDDYKDYLEFATDPAVMLSAGVTYVKKSDEQDFLKNKIADRHSMAMVLKDSKKVIGSLSFHDDLRRMRINSKIVEYALNQKYWGNGYMAEALKAIIVYGFQELDLEVIAASHFTDNEKADRVIKNSGFTDEGVLRSGSRRLDGRVFDEHCYSITKEEYHSKLL